MVFLCFDYLHSDIVLWVEGPPFVDSCSIFWTKLCDSRLSSMIHYTYWFWKGVGGPDPAFPLLFHANPASRTFCHRFPDSRFSFLKNSYKSKISSRFDYFAWSMRWGNASIESDLRCINPLTHSPEGFY